MVGAMQNQVGTSKPRAPLDLTAGFTAVEIEINHHCNRKCSYCPNSISKRKSTGLIDRAIYTKLMTELSEIGFEGRISYEFYNEPMLHPDFDDIVAETRRSLPKSPIVLYTNGTKLTRERFDRLVEHGITTFIVTRHEADVDNPKYAFAATFATLDGEAKTRVRYRDFTDVRLANRGGLLKHLGADGLPLHPCYIPSHIVTITVGGNVLPCFEDFHEEMAMGNLNESTLMEIWNSEPYNRMRRELRMGARHMRGPCKNCNKRDVLPPFN